MVVKRSIENFLERVNELKIAGLSTSFGDEGLEKNKKKTCQTISNEEEPSDFALYPEDEEPWKNELEETDLCKSDRNTSDQCGI